MPTTRQSGISTAAATDQLDAQPGSAALRVSRSGLRVADGMSRDVLTIGPGHTLREAAMRMSARRVGAAVVLDGDTAGIGILTERDVLNSVAAGQDPDHERVGDHLSMDLVYAAPDWDLDVAAATMDRGGFRHLIVLSGGEVTGMLSMRDVVRCWLAEGGR